MKRRLLILVIILCHIFLLSGFSSCRGGNKHVVHPPKDPKKATCDPGAWGGTIKLALSGGPLTFNPFLASSAETHDVTSKLFGTLLDYDNANQKPADDGIARSIDSPDNKSYVIHIREGASFSNGIPITADDVIFSFKAALDKRLNCIYGDMMKIDGKEPEFSKQDTLTVKITFPEHYEPIKDLLCRVPIVSKNAMEDFFLRGDPVKAYNLDTAPDKIVGSGAFMLKRYQADKQIDLEYNPYYWKVDNAGTALPYADGLTYFLKRPQQTQQVNFLTDNQIQAIQVLPTQQKELENNPRFIVKKVGPSLHTWQIILNWRTDRTKNDPVKATWFRTSAFRWGVSSLIDRDRIVKEVFASQARPAYNQISPENKLWFNPNAKKYDYNVGAGAKYLSDMRFVNSKDKSLKDGGGNLVRFHMLYLNEYLPIEIANHIVDDLKKAGIEIETEPQDHKKLWDFINRGFFEAALVETTPMFADPAFLQPYLNKNGRFFSFYDAGAGDNVLRGGSSNATEAWMDRISKSMNDALKTNSIKERQDLYNKIQEEWAERAGIIYLVNTDVIVAAQSELGNFKPATIDPIISWNAEEFFLKK